MSTRSLLCALVLLALRTPPACTQTTMVNFSHLDHLTEQKVVEGSKVSIVHIYANYPSYAWVAAAESGPEGIACVDDAARAAVLSLRAFELRQDTAALTRARGYLRFVLKMQARDGEFYNFIFQDGRINRKGKTSFKSFGWWAARGVWAMGTGARVLASADPAFSGALSNAVQRSLPHARQLLLRYGQFKTIEGLRLPQWLLYDSGADATSELLLGLIELYSASPDASLGELITKLSEGIRVMQDGDADTFPHGLHRSWETMWHMWGNGQTQALASLKGLPDATAALASAEREARSFYVRLLVEGFMKEMDVAKPGKKVMFEQIAYAVRPMAVGLLRLHEATGKREYAVMAGLAASWLTGNNPLGKPMYDPATGRGYDGIRDARTMNMNSGAESTIEALMTLLEIEHTPEALRYLHFRRKRSQTNGKRTWALFEGPGGGKVVLALEENGTQLRLREGKAAEDFLALLKGGE